MTSRIRASSSSFILLVLLISAIGSAGGCASTPDRRDVLLQESSEITLTVRNKAHTPLTLKSSTPATVPDRTLQPAETQEVRFKVVKMIPMYELNHLAKDHPKQAIEIPEDLKTLEVVAAKETPFIVEAAGATVLLKALSSTGENCDQAIEVGPCLFDGHAGPFEIVVEGQQSLDGPIRLCDED